MYVPEWRVSPTEDSQTNLQIKGVKLLKCVEGQFNKAFLLTMNNGFEIIARLPNPNAGPAFYTTASEVATRHFVWHILLS